MAQDFRSARFWAAEMVMEALSPGSVAVDATMGNGHDTLWLCNLVGETGRVYAFDVQQEALEHTRMRLQEANMLSRAKLFLSGHQYMANFVQESADCVLFNLGWLPGAAHCVTTKTQTTLTAVQAALAILKDGGLLTICVYPGHEEGMRELDALIEWASSLNPQAFDVIHKRYLNQRNNPPQLIAVLKRPGNNAKHKPKSV